MILINNNMFTNIQKNSKLNGETTIDNLIFKSNIEINHTQHLLHTQYINEVEVVLYIDNFNLSQKLYYEYLNQNKLFSLEYRESDIIYECSNCYIVRIDINSIHDSTIRINCDGLNLKTISKNEIRKKKLKTIKNYGRE